jgi:hypothetical protein
VGYVATSSLLSGCRGDTFSGAVDAGDDATAAQDGADAAGDATHLCQTVQHDFCVDFDDGTLAPASESVRGDGGAGVDVDRAVGRGSPYSLAAHTPRADDWAYVYHRFAGGLSQLSMAFDLRVDTGGVAGAPIDVATWALRPATGADGYDVFLRIRDGELQLTDDLPGALADGGAGKILALTTLPLPSAAWIHVDFSLTFTTELTTGTSTVTYTVRVDGRDLPRGTGTKTTQFVPAMAQFTDVAVGVMYTEQGAVAVHVDNVVADARR